MNLRCFKLYRAYYISFTSSNVGKCFWSWILKDCIKVQEKKKKVVVLCSRPRQNVNLGIFTLYMRNGGKEMYKTSVMHVESCCFANVNLSLFCRSRCRHRRRCWSSLILRLKQSFYRYVTSSGSMSKIFIHLSVQLQGTKKIYLLCRFKQAHNSLVFVVNRLQSHAYQTICKTHIHPIA